MKQKGQALVILLLIMLVALTTGLAITQRSISNLASSNKIDQSSRAFSAAEAGIENAIQMNQGSPLSSVSTSLTFQNESSVTVKSSGPLPKNGQENGVGTGQALEYPPIGKDTFAQFWLADPTTLNAVYTASTINLYFGNLYSNPQDPDTPALEVNLITYVGSGNNCPTNPPTPSSGGYCSFRNYYDPISSRRTSNNFNDCTINTPTAAPSTTINTTNSKDANPSDKDQSFRCKVVVTIPASLKPIMVRARVLYTNTSQPIALEPVTNNSLPHQAIIYTSIGASGVTQRKLQVFKLQYVVPPYFDFSIFSAGDINK